MSERPHSTCHGKTYPQAKKQNRLDTHVLWLCNSALYDLPKEYKDETYLSTLRSQEKTHPRISGSHEDTRRAGGNPGASSQGPCETRGLILSGQNFLLRADCCVRMVLNMSCAPKMSQTSSSKFFFLAISRTKPVWGSSRARNRYLVQYKGIA